INSRDKAPRVSHQSSFVQVAETDRNRTCQTKVLGLTGFEDRGAHQDTYASTTQSSRLGNMTPKLTSFAAGGGCACKIPAGQLESAIAGLIGNDDRSEEHTSELQSRFDLVCRLLLEKKKKMMYHVEYGVTY